MDGMEWLNAPPPERVVLEAIYERRRKRLEEQERKSGG